MKTVTVTAATTQPARHRRDLTDAQLAALRPGMTVYARRRLNPKSYPGGIPAGMPMTLVRVGRFNEPRLPEQHGRAEVTVRVPGSAWEYGFWATNVTLTPPPLPSEPGGPSGRQGRTRRAGRLSRPVR